MLHPPLPSCPDPLLGPQGSVPDDELELVGHEGEEAEPPEGAVEGGVDSGPAAVPDAAPADQEGAPAVVASLPLGEAGDSHGSQDSTAESDAEGDQIHVPEEVDVTVSQQSDSAPLPSRSAPETRTSALCARSRPANRTAGKEKRMIAKSSTNG